MYGVWTEGHETDFTSFLRFPTSKQVSPKFWKKQREKWFADTEAVLPLLIMAVAWKLLTSQVPAVLHPTVPLSCPSSVTLVPKRSLLFPTSAALTQLGIGGTITVIVF
ncbi:hypothetical protein BCR33DRAFT_363970 [Rhizoclosmatium globosum]|uniref:Uncharacterized protein n=1 Tax=Rhizoclosmatium globosum TaxID=329046 RepID=A0A1Y2C0K0_9FUNG|nr:hypothetical protein BCR33DRAFT_363970 [Rhizoclosmatium globosum]|eukprot:ORY40397.1 hypothetical protein BCR33DRAFT_363970 [Rhizoclosmatium globosum]